MSGEGILETVGVLTTAGTSETAARPVAEVTTAKVETSAANNNWEANSRNDDRRKNTVLVSVNSLIFEANGKT